MNSTQLDDHGVLLTCRKCNQRNRLKYDKLGGTGRCGKCGTELSAPGEPIDVASDLAFDAFAKSKGISWDEYGNRMQPGFRSLGDVIRHDPGMLARRLLENVREHLFLDVERLSLEADPLCSFR